MDIQWFLVDAEGQVCIKRSETKGSNVYPFWLRAVLIGLITCETIATYDTSCSKYSLVRRLSLHNKANLDILEQELHEKEWVRNQNTVKLHHVNVSPMPSILEPLCEPLHSNVVFTIGCSSKPDSFGEAGLLGESDRPVWDRIHRP